MGLCIHNWNKKINKQSHLHLLMSNSQLYSKTFQRIFPHKETGVWMFLPSRYCGTGVSVGNTAVLISKIDIFAVWYGSCSNYNFLCSCFRGHLPRCYSLLTNLIQMILIAIINKNRENLLEGLSNLYVSQKKKKHFIA